MTREEVTQAVVGERFTSHIPGYLTDDPERCAQRRLVLAEAIDEMPEGCGTRAGYERHRRAGQKACDACQDARREYNRATYRRRKQPARIAAKVEPT